MLGASALRALAVDVVRNVVGPVLVLATLGVGTAILLLAGLSFLGLGARPPAAEWGSMISSGAANFQAWWLGTFPGLAVLTVVLGFNFLGDGLRDAFDPRSVSDETLAAGPRPGWTRMTASGNPVVEETNSGLLAVRHLQVQFGTESNPVTVVDDVAFDLEPGKVLGIAGESGSGKTMTALAMLGLLPAGSRVSGQILLEGQNVLDLRGRALRQIQGRTMAMVFQDPTASLHPMLTIGRQLTEHMQYHLRLSRRAANARAVELLDQVRIPDPKPPSTPIHINSVAACGSESRSPSPWRAIRGC